ncbi:hypothetical protein AALA21_01025 [Eggerthellaceae bacterium 3-80]|nr:hypothetical protein D7W09_01285 [bacterium D16-34]
MLSKKRLEWKLSILADILAAQKTLRNMFPERNDWDLVSEVNDMLSEEEAARMDVESDIACPLSEQGIPYYDIFEIIDDEIAAMGLEPMHFNPELRREDFI